MILFKHWQLFYGTKFWHFLVKIVYLNTRWLVKILMEAILQCVWYFESSEKSNNFAYLPEVLKIRLQLLWILERILEGNYELWYVPI